MSDTRYSRVYSGAIVGAEAQLISIETAMASGLPRHSVVGLPGTAVRECLDRIWSAMRSTDMPLPRGVITINLAPADVQKHGTGFDLAIATGLLAAAWDGPRPPILDSTAFAGELALDGSIRAVRGILPVVLGARRARLQHVVVPEGNVQEACHVPGIDIWPVSSLRDIPDLLAGGHISSRVSGRKPRRPGPGQPSTRRPDFSDVVGQQSVVDALVVAAVGGHNVLMIGPPGCGKTMMAERFAGILPSWSTETEFVTNCMHSVRGLLPKIGWLHERPFRSPHHTVSRAGMLGGGTPIQPGEISLAHGGVLYLDEMPEYPRSVLESLREPLDAGRIVLSRAGGSVTYHASFQLLASMNPCPCGYLGSETRSCVCPPPTRVRYRSKVSGPLLDRIDMHLELQPVDPVAASSDGVRETTTLRARVEQAILFRKQRKQHAPNARLPAKTIMTDVTQEGIDSLNRFLANYSLSMRSRDRILRMARTIADLNGNQTIDEYVIGQAVKYRVLERQNVS